VQGALKGESMRAQVGCTAEGKLLALEVTMYSNGGNSLDLSASIMDRALLHIDCVYRIPNTRAVGHICRTNHASNTAFRGFGGPQVPGPYPVGILHDTSLPSA
jgi:xanthine dehydrogenase/oxidase